MNSPDRIEYVDPRILTPDPKNPRRSIPELQTARMAASFETDGIINPIEVDDDNMIVTGHVRWSAAMHLNMEQVPIKRYTPATPYDRLRRQLKENLHQSGSDLPGFELVARDQGMAFMEMLSHYERHIGTGGSNVRTAAANAATDKGIRWLAKELSISHTQVIRRLRLVDGAFGIDERLRDAVEARLVAPRVITELADLPNEAQPLVTERILTEAVKMPEGTPPKSRVQGEAVRTLGKALKAAPPDEWPLYVEALVAGPTSTADTRRNLELLRTPAQQAKDALNSADAFEALLKKTLEAVQQSGGIRAFPPTHQTFILHTVQDLQAALMDFAGGAEMPHLIEAEALA